MRSTRPSPASRRGPCWTRTKRSCRRERWRCWSRSEQREEAPVPEWRLQVAGDAWDVEILARDFTSGDPRVIHDQERGHHFVTFSGLDQVEDYRLAADL